MNWKVVKMSSLYLLRQEATEEILSRVTSMCGECYYEIIVGNIIHYHMQKYHYICEKCQESYLLEYKEVSLLKEEEGAILF